MLRAIDGFALSIDCAAPSMDPLIAHLSIDGWNMLHVLWCETVLRAKTDMPILPCEITEVFGDKVKTYRLGTMFGTIKGNFRGGDLQSYDGSVAAVHGGIRFVKQPRNLIHVISSQILLQMFKWVQDKSVHL